MIEMTVQQMIGAVPALRKLNEQKMPARTAYHVARIIREIEKELANFQEARNKLIERFGKKDEAGKLIEDKDGNAEIFPEKRDTFNKEAQDLLESKIHVNCEQIALEDLSDGEFSPAEIKELILFIKE